MWTWIIVAATVMLVLLLCFALAVASFSFDNYAEKLKVCSKIKNSYGWNTLEFVDAMNQEYFGGKLKIARTREWDDHYSTGVVALSEKTMQNSSLASLSIVSHELGHARQDASGNTLKKFWRLRRTGRLFGFFIMPLILVGIVLCLLWVFGVLPNLAYVVVGGACVAAGVAIFGFAVALKWQEIKIEKEASAFALKFLEEYLTEEELATCKDFLKSACLTYWASLIRTILGWTMLTNKDKAFE